MKKISMILCIAIFTLLIGTYVQAGATVFEPYNTTVGKFNGSGYTGYQTKSKSGVAGEIYVTSVGGGYKVDARQISSSSNGSWSTNIDNNTTYRTLPNSINAGSSTRVQFSNDITTPVTVQVTGQFRSN